MKLASVHCKSLYTQNESLIINSIGSKLDIKCWVLETRCRQPMPISLCRFLRLRHGNLSSDNWLCGYRDNFVINDCGWSFGQFVFPLQLCLALLQGIQIKVHGLDSDALDCGKLLNSPV